MQRSGDAHNPNVLALGSSSPVADSFSDDYAVGTPSRPLCLWRCEAGAPRMTRAVRLACANRQRFQITLGVLRKSFYYRIWWIFFFMSGCFHKKCPQTPVSARDSWAVGILPFLQYRVNVLYMQFRLLINYSLCKSGTYKLFSVIENYLWIILFVIHRYVIYSLLYWHCFLG